MIVGQYMVHAAKSTRVTSEGNQEGWALWVGRGNKAWGIGFYKPFKFTLTKVTGKHAKYLCGAGR